MLVILETSRPRSAGFEGNGLRVQPHRFAPVCRNGAPRGSALLASSRRRGSVESHVGGCICRCPDGTHQSDCGQPEKTGSQPVAAVIVHRSRASGRPLHSPSARYRAQYRPRAHCGLARMMAGDARFRMVLTTAQHHGSRRGGALSTVSRPLITRDRRPRANSGKPQIVAGHPTEPRAY